MPDELVDRVVLVVRYNTGDPQPTTVAEYTIVAILAANESEDATAVREAIQTAVAEGRLVEERGRYRVAT